MDNKLQSSKDQLIKYAQDTTNPNHVRNQIARHKEEMMYVAWYAFACGMLFAQVIMVMVFTVAS